MMTRRSGFTPKEGTGSAALGAVAAASLLLSSAVQAQTIVKTSGGTVEGTLERDVVSFKGIPLGEPPVGELRWRDARPAKPWSGVLKANKFAAPCAQPASPWLEGAVPSEDCLYLNIWTENRNPADKRPVIVWIYGGGFTAGFTGASGSDGTALTRKGVVLVSLPYRVGALGYMAHPELTKENPHGSSGQYAMSDLVLGLRWVNENIASFGGDPANVTLMGCSAGSYMSSFLMASPHAKGLFHRVIAESGAKFSPGLNATLAPLSESEERGLSFARRLGASNLAELRAMSADTIVATQQATGSGDMALPGTDGYWLPLDTYTAAEKGYYADVPLLTGSSLNEATIFPTTWKPLATPEAMRALAEKEAPGNAPEFFRYYPANTPAEALRSAVNWSTDVGFAHGNYALAKINTERGQPTYVFRNALPAAGELAKRAGGAFPPEMMRGMHCGENIYAFGNLERGQGKLSGDAITEADRELQDLLTSYWTNFAKTGNPNGGSLPHWPRYDLERMEALTIDKPAQVQRAPDGERLRFFDQLTEERRKRETAQK